MVFLEFAHKLWETTRRKIVLTDNTFFLNKSDSVSIVECMRLFVAIQLQNNTRCRFSQHCSWLSFQTETQSHGKDTSQILGRYPNNTHWSDHILLRCRWWRTTFLHTSRQKSWVRKTNPWKKGTVLTKCEAIGGKRETTLLEYKCGRSYKGRRKH